MVSDQTLYTDMWSAVRTILVSASLSTTEGTSITSASINAAYNDKASSRPQVVIMPVQRDSNPDKFGVIYGKTSINLDIECYATSTLAADQLMQQVDYALSSNLIDNVDLVSFSTNYAYNLSAESKSHLKTGTFIYTKE